MLALAILAASGSAGAAENSTQFACAPQTVLDDCADAGCATEHAFGFGAFTSDFDVACTYLISVPSLPAGSAIRLSFDNQTLHGAAAADESSASSACATASADGAMPACGVSIYDGATDLSPLLAYFACDAQVWDLAATGRTMLLAFAADASACGGGMKAKWTVAPVACGNSICEGGEYASCAADCDPSRLPSPEYTDLKLCETVSPAPPSYPTLPPDPPNFPPPPPSYPSLPPPPPPLTV